MRRKQNPRTHEILIIIHCPSLSTWIFVLLFDIQEPYTAKCCANITKGESHP